MAVAVVDAHKSGEVVQSAEALKAVANKGNGEYFDCCEEAIGEELADAIGVSLALAFLMSSAFLACVLCALRRKARRASAG